MHIQKLPDGSRVQLLAPVVRGRKGHYRELFEEITRDGFVRVRIDGVVHELTKGLQADRYKVHNIEIVVDRLVIRSDGRSRVADSVDVALRFGNGVLIVSPESPTAVGTRCGQEGEGRQKGAAQKTRLLVRSCTAGIWHVRSAISATKIPRPMPSPSTHRTVLAPSAMVWARSKSWTST